MKQFGKKIALFVMAFVFVAVAVCAVATVGNGQDDIRVAQAETQVTNDLFVVNYSDTELELLVNGSIRDYLDVATSDLSQLKNTLLTALRSIITNGILNGDSSLSAAGELPEGFDPSSFDWNSSELLNKFKDYVVDRLSDAEEFQKYVDGEYDLIIDYAIGSYIENKTENVEEEYSKIQSAIQDVVDQAYENAYENAKNDLGEYFDEEEWAAKKEQASEKVAERVETVQTSGGKVTVTFKQIIAAVSGLSVDGTVVFTKANGLSSAGLKEIAKALPRPSAIANMSESELASLLRYDVVVNTTYGDVAFAVKFGFFGNVQNVKSLAKTVADHVTVAVNGSSVDVKLNVPALFSDVLTKFYSSSKFTAEQKSFVFDLFDKNATEIDVDEVLAFIKGIDYKYFLTNLYNVEYMNEYFGKYVAQVLGYSFTETTMDKLVEKVCDYIAPKMLTAESLSVDELIDWLRTNVPGLGNASDSTLTDLAGLLKDFASKTDWTNFDAAYVRSLLEDSTYDLNGEIATLIDLFQGTEGLYETTVRYFEKAINALPTFAKTHSILDCYDGENFSVSGNVNVQYKTIFTKAASVLSRLGMDNLAKYVGNASSLLDVQSLNVDVSATVVVPELNRVDYVVNGETVLSGLLPAGLNGEIVESLSQIETANAYNVMYWVEKDSGERLTSMPDANVTLVPVYDLSVTLSDGVDAVYDANVDYTIKATVNGSSEAVYSYAWYKDGVQINESDSSVIVKNVEDSGEYYVVVTDNAIGVSAKSEIVIVNVSPKTLNAPDNKWNTTNRYVYGEEVEYSYNGLSDSVKDLYTEIEYSATVRYLDGGEKVPFDLSSDKVWNAGVYLVKASFALNDDNYVSADGRTKWTKTLVIQVKPKTLSLAYADWIVSDNLVYDGTAKSVALSLEKTNLTAEEKAYVLSSISYTVNNESVDTLSFVDAGVYVIKAIASDANAEVPNANYKLDAIVSKTVIVSKATATATVEWNYSAPFTYDGSVHALSATVSVVSGQTALTDSDYTYSVYGVSSAKNAGEYKAVAVVKVTNANYILSESVFDKTWVIDPLAIDAPSAWTDEFEFVYGQKVSVNYNGLTHPEYFTAIKYSFEKDGEPIDVINGRSILDAGVYTVKATFGLANGNYVVSNSVEKTWFLANTVTVSPKTLTLPSAIWNTPTSSVYNSMDKLVTVNLREADLTATERVYLSNNLVYSVNGVATSYPVRLTDAGSYKITASLMSGNYIVKVASLDYTITPATVKVMVNWGVTTAFTYTGEAKTLDVSVKVLFNGVELGSDDFVVTKGGVLTAVEKGNYVATVKVVLTNSNFVLADNGQYTQNWTIAIDSSATWEGGKKFETKDNVTLEVISGSVPKDYTVSTSKSQLTDEQLEKIKKAIDEKDIELVSAYDIHFQDASKVERTVDGKFKVVLPIPQKYLNYKGSLGVVHIDDNGEVTVVVGAVRNGDNMEFVTDGFSVFAVIAIPEANARSIVPLIIVIVILAIVLIVTIVLLIVLAKRHKNKKKEDENEEKDSTDDTSEEINEEATTETTETEETTESVEDTTSEIVEESVEPTEETVEEPAETTEESVVEEAMPEETPTETIETPVEDTVEPIVEETSEPEPDVAVEPVLTVDPVLTVEPVVAESETVEVLDRSFLARLSQSDDVLKANYDALKNYALSFKGVRSRVSWAYDSINKGRKKVCKIIIRGKSLTLFVALNPYSLPEKYHCKSVGNVSKYAATPTKLKVRSGRSLKYAKELISLVMTEYGVKQGDVAKVKYAPDCKSDDELKAMGLIKVKVVKGGNGAPWGKK